MVDLAYRAEIENFALLARDDLLRLSFEGPDLHLAWRRLNMLGEFIPFVGALSDRPVDLSTCTLHCPQEHPRLFRFFQACDHAMHGFALLRGRRGLKYEDWVFDMQVQNRYMRLAGNRIETMLALPETAPVPMPQDFKKLSVQVFIKAWDTLQNKTPAIMNEVLIERRWAALLDEDIRYCWACPREGWAALKEMAPSTIPLLDAYDIHCFAMSTDHAIDMLWTPALCSSGHFEQLELPTLDDLT